MATSTALYTDHYELTMVGAALKAGIADQPSVFETFSRRLPEGRRYGVFAGLGRLLDALESFRFGSEELTYLADRGLVDETALDWLADYAFTGSITAYAEGDLYFPGSPVLRVEGPFAASVLLETLVLSHLNYDSAIASAAARMVGAAQGRSLLEFGSRRAHEQAAVAAARAAYLAGFAATSNLEAGRRYGIPTSGTSAHAFTLAFADEREAFAAQVDALGASTTLLVDTYDIEQGIRHAVEAAGTGLGGIRIDSSDLVAEAHRARALLDSLGATGTRIVLSGDLDEYVIAELARTPADALGVGTRLVTGSGAPTGEFVFKLVATAPGGRLIDVAKGGGVKSTVGGTKRAWRAMDREGRAVEEVVAPADASPPGTARDLQRPVVTDGVVLARPSLSQVREDHAGFMAELPPQAHALDPGPPALPTRRILEAP